jgi:hypothetical protein
MHWIGGWVVPRAGLDAYPYGLTQMCRALHGVIFQKKVLFKTTAVKTSNPTNERLFISRLHVREY